ncbi:MAG: hypothetical protein GY805_26835 [Chloroflexi bacterium]|nr:hypothetical protein [Chloroflexota bacterium]
MMVVVGFGLIVAIFIPIGIGHLMASWLITWLWPAHAAALFGWVVGGITAVILTLLGIATWALYQDKIWQGFMHPIAFMGNIVLLIVALLTLPSLWGQLRLLHEGETAVGKVTRLSTGLNYDPETNLTNTIYYLSYQFETSFGENYQPRIEVAQSVQQQFEEEAAIDIRYLPNRPRYSLPQIAVQPQDRAQNILAMVLAVYAVIIETAVIQYFWKRRLESFLDRWDK